MEIFIDLKEPPTLDEVKSGYVKEIYTLCDYNAVKAAKILGITDRTIQNYKKKWRQDEQG